MFGATTRYDTAARVREFRRANLHTNGAAGYRNEKISPCKTHYYCYFNRPLSDGTTGVYDDSAASVVERSTPSRFIDARKTSDRITRQIVVVC